jgi:hypothetical protein
MGGPGGEDEGGPALRADSAGRKMLPQDFIKYGMEGLQFGKAGQSIGEDIIKSYLPKKPGTGSEYEIKEIPNEKGEPYFAYVSKTPGQPPIPISGPMATTLERNVQALMKNNPGLDRRNATSMALNAEKPMVIPQGASTGTLDLNKIPEVPGAAPGAVPPVPTPGGAAPPVAPPTTPVPAAPPVAAPTPAPQPAAAAAGPSDIESAEAEAEKGAGIPSGTLALRRQLENSPVDSVSTAGARGLHQITPDNVAAYSKREGRPLDPTKPKDSSFMAAQVAKDAQNLYPGNEKAQVAYYNGGKAAGDAVAAGKPTNKETTGYVQRWDQLTRGPRLPTQDEILAMGSQPPGPTPPPTLAGPAVPGAVPGNAPAALSNAPVQPSTAGPSTPPTQAPVSTPPKAAPLPSDIRITPGGPYHTAVNLTDPRMKITSGGGNQKGEEKLLADAKDVRDEFTKSGLADYEQELVRVENMLKNTKKGELKGFGKLANMLPTGVTNAVSSEALANRTTFAPLARIETLNSSGKATTPTEIKKVQEVAGAGNFGQTEDSVRQGVKQLRERIDAIKRNAMLGVHPDVQFYLRRTGGVTGNDEVPMDKFLKE